MRGDFFNSYEARLRFALYDTDSESVRWIVEQDSWHGRSVAIAEKGGNFYIGGSVDVTDGIGGMQWYGSVTKLRLDSNDDISVYDSYGF